MRKFGPFLAIALLSACGAPEAADEGADEVDIAAPAPVPPAAPQTPSTPPSVARSDTIPAAFLGRYDGSAEACARPSDSKLTVGPGELRFHESIGVVRTVGIKGPEAIEVEADYQGEGESWRSVRELSLSDGGATLTIGGDGTRMVRVRCPAVTP